MNRCIVYVITSYCPSSSTVASDQDALTGSCRSVVFAVVSPAERSESTREAGRLWSYILRR